jgi:hypothetical protein
VLTDGAARPAFTQPKRCTQTHRTGDASLDLSPPCHPPIPHREKNVANFRGIPAHVLDRLDRAFAKKGSETAQCVGCGELFERPVGRGRPRLYCPGCVPPVGVAGAGEAARRWRELNPEAVEAYNQARRVSHEPRACVECGEQFRPNRADRLVCSDGCRWARKRRLKRLREAAT